MKRKQEEEKARIRAVLDAGLAEKERKKTEQDMAMQVGDPSVNSIMVSKSRYITKHDTYM